MKKKLLLLPLLVSLSILSAEANANCPQPRTVIYKCADWNGHKMCTWGPMGGWYQGSADNSPSLKDGDHLGPDAFQKAVWFPYRDEAHGATNCFYKGPEGERVTLFQQTGYGDVPPPVGKLWTPSTVEGFPNAFECTVGAAACKFEFGERF